MNDTELLEAARWWVDHYSIDDLAARWAWLDKQLIAKPCRELLDEFHITSAAISVSRKMQ